MDYNFKRMTMQQDRRNFLKNAAALSGSFLFVADPVSALSEAMAHAVRPSRQVEVFINQYTVSTFYAREAINFKENLNRCLAEMKEAGLAGLEVSVGKMEELDEYMSALQKNGLQLRSIYTEGNLHDEATAETEIKRVTALAERAKTAGTKVVVLNPRSKSGKSDAELSRQNQSLDTLGAALRRLGMTFALHYHTTELEFAAREFHSAMCDTSPENVSLCFDVHWSYRASGNSAVSARNHAMLYADRIAELHLRQSQGGVWTETFVANADIDYGKIYAILRQGKGFDDCLVVLEQAPENGTPKTRKPLDIFRLSVEEIKKMYD